MAKIAGEVMAMHIRARSEEICVLIRVTQQVLQMRQPKICQYSVHTQFPWDHVITLYKGQLTGGSPTVKCMCLMQCPTTHCSMQRHSPKYECTCLAMTLLGRYTISRLCTWPHSESWSLLWRLIHSCYDTQHARTHAHTHTRAHTHTHTRAHTHTCNNLSLCSLSNVSTACQNHWTTGWVG